MMVVDEDDTTVDGKVEMTRSSGTLLRRRLNKVSSLNFDQSISEEMEDEITPLHTFDTTFIGLTCDTTSPVVNDRSNRAGASTTDNWFDQAPEMDEYNRTQELNHLFNDIVDNEMKAK